MDDTEAHVFSFLNHLKIGPVVYEPVPNSPPDFLINEQIAVEATCLTEQFFTDDGSASPLNTELAFFSKRIPFLLDSLGPSTDGICWFVSIHFGRPLPTWKHLQKELPKRLEQATDRPQFDRLGRITFSIDETFEVTLNPVPSENGKRFQQFATSDHEAGGCMVYKFEINIIHSINTKNRKTVDFRSLYQSWWLVIVDAIGNLSYDQSELAWIKSNQSIPRVFDRTIVLSPSDAIFYFDL